MLDEESLLKQVQKRWTNWVSQVPVFGFNSGKCDLNLVKEYFVKTPSDMTNVTVVKKDNLYTFLMFKVLDVKDYLAPGLSYAGCCKANGCTMEKLVFPCEWLDDYVGPVEYENFYSKLKGGFRLLQVNTPSLFENFTPEDA